MIVYDTIIIGGGLSGLSAAVELSALGYKVLLLEQNRQCGGRTRSFTDFTTGDCIDNGQHLMMGCYYSTRRYLHMIGSEHLASLQPVLRIDFFSPSRNPSSFACLNLPAPLHLLSGLLGFTAVSLKDRLKMLLIVKELFSTAQEKELDLDRITAEKWLNNLGQSDTSKKYLWDVVTIGALNNRPQKVSALMLYRVLKAAFLKQKENSSLLIPRVGLSDLFVNPAVEFIQVHGGKVCPDVGIESFIIDGNRLNAVRTTDGKYLYAKSFISAIQWHAYKKIQIRSKSGNKHIIAGKVNLKSDLQSSSIISIHLWLDWKITDIDFAALIDTHVQWMFNKNNLFNVESNDMAVRQILSLVISDADKVIGLTKDQLVNIALKDLHKVLPKAHKAKVIHSLIIKEKRATFTPYPGLESLRHGTQSEFKNLFLAGDWTATGYPATIEGAVMSGSKAAKFTSNLLSANISK